MNLTVITASFNSSKYLTDTVESVARQTIKPTRHIIVDDCSSDDSYTLALSFQEKYSHVSVLRNSQNKGYPASLNAGINEANTEYIAILDADDIALPGWLELINEKITHFPDAGLIGGGCYIMTEDGQNTSYKKYCEYKGDVTDIIRNGKYAILHPGSVIKKEKLKQIGCYREDLKSLEDSNMMIDMAWTSNIVHTGEPLILYRRLRLSESRKAEEYTQLVKSFLAKKIALLNAGIALEQTYIILSNEIGLFQSLKRINSVARGCYEMEMANAFWRGNKYRQSIVYFYKVVMSGYFTKKKCINTFKALVVTKVKLLIKCILNHKKS